jgi:hypothetical protein
MPAVGKDSVNPHFQSKYTSLDSLIAATRGPLNEAGLAITQFPAINELAQPVLRTVITHGPSGEEISSDIPLLIVRQDMQNLGSALTYARRYAWAAMLGIAAEEDLDGEPAAPPPKPAEEEKVPTKRLATKPQMANMAALTKQLDEQNVTMPAEYSAGAEGWVDVLRQRLAEYGVAHRNELTTGQASELIDWLEQQAIPF